MIDSIEMVGTADLLVDLAERPKTITKALVRALNRSIKSAETVVVRAIAGDTGLRSKDVRETISIRNAYLSGEHGSIEAKLSASLKKLKLSRFNPSGPMPSRGKGKGVTYRLGSGRKTIPDAFMAQMKSGHIGVFRRIAESTKKSPGGWGFNLPILELEGPSIGHVFRKFRQAGIDRAKEVFDKNFDHELSFAGSGGTNAGTE